MLQSGPALKVSIYLNRDTDASQGFLADEILTFLQARDADGATVIQAHAGFGAHHQLHVEGGGSHSAQHAPILICFITTQQQFATLKNELLTMVTDGLVEVQETQVLRHAARAPKVVG